MFHLAIFGDKSKLAEEVKSIASSISYYTYDLEKIMDPIEPRPSSILCFANSEIPALEIAQCLRMNYPDISIFYLVFDKSDFDKKKLVKNGFTDAYLLPWEKADLIKSLRNESVFSIMPELRDYKPIKVADLSAGDILDFGMRIFLPRNNKLLPFSMEGEPISIEKMKKLHENNTNTLFVHKDDVSKFFDYTAKALKKTLKGSGMSETEKQEKLDRAVRDLLSDLYITDERENTFSKSQNLLKEVKEVIHLLMADTHSDFLSKINVMINQEDNFYLHLSNVSTYAGVFAIILGFEKPEDMALAGLLHDIGKINLPVEISQLEMKQMGPEALAAYKNHPLYSLDVIKLKKVVISDNVMKAITQHHENINGSGYPAGLQGLKISPEGRLLAIANTFDHLTSLRPGEASLSPTEAINIMIDNNSRDPGRVELDIDYLKKLRDFFMKSDSHAA